MNRLDEVADAGQASFALAGDLLAVAEAMDAQYLLRRSLSDPNVDVEQRKHLAEALLGTSLSPGAIMLVQAAVEQPWRNADAMAWAIRDEAVRQVWRATVADRSVEQVREQVYSLLLLASSDPAVSTALNDSSRDVAARQSLAMSLVAADGQAMHLLVRSAAQDPRGSFAVNLDGYLQSLAELRGRLRARVTTAVALRQNQIDDLVSQLTRIYSTPIDLEPVVDADVIGGVRVDAGGDVIDGSVIARLDAAREAMATVTVTAGKASEDR